MSKTKIEHFAPLIHTANAESNSPWPMRVQEARRCAGEWFAENGFPSARDEEWRFTDISPIRNAAFRLAESRCLSLDNIRPFLLDGGELPRLVFVNGRFDAELSSQKALAGVSLMSLREAAKQHPQVIEHHLAGHAAVERHGFAALNTGLLGDGAFLQVEKGTALEQPILLLFVSAPAKEPSASFLRNLFIFGEAAQASFIESYVSLGDGVHFTNAVSELVVGDDAVVEHYKLQQENGASFHIATIQVNQGRGSVYTSHNHSFGAGIARNDLNIVLNGEGAESTLNGLYLTVGDQLVDNHSVIEHAKPHCNSRELYKGILNDRSRAVFSGKIHVHKDAQKTDAIQSNQNLLLSDEATVDTQPQLEIYADDVRCTHGGTVGQLDENGIFYLRARGISKENAHLLMIHAFAGEVVDAIKLDSLREHVTQLVNARLQAGVEPA